MYLDIFRDDGVYDHIISKVLVTINCFEEEK